MQNSAEPMEVAKNESHMIPAANNADIFIKIGDGMNINRTSLPGEWIPQVIVNEFPCVMWTVWKHPDYFAIDKRVVLLPDMRVHVSYTPFHEINALSGNLKKNHRKVVVVQAHRGVPRINVL